MPPKTPPDEKNRENGNKSLILTDAEVKVIERLVRTDNGLGIADLISGEYASMLEGLSDSQKLQLLVKLERLGIL